MEEGALPFGGVLWKRELTDTDDWTCNEMKTIFMEHNAVSTSRCAEFLQYTVVVES